MAASLIFTPKTSLTGKICDGTISHINLPACRRLHAGNILMNINSSVIPENLVLLTKSEQSGPKTAHIRPTSRNEAQTRARLPVQTHGC